MTHPRLRTPGLMHRLCIFFKVYKRKKTNNVRFPTGPTSMIHLTVPRRRMAQGCCRSRTLCTRPSITARWTWCERYSSSVSIRMPADKYCRTRTSSRSHRPVRLARPTRATFRPVMTSARSMRTRRCSVRRTTSPPTVAHL